MGKFNYVFAVVNYVDTGDVDYSVIYIAPETYWEEVGSLDNYTELNEGELQRYISVSCGSEIESWDVIHWYSTGDVDMEEIEDLLTDIGMKKSDSLKEYAEKEVQEFGDQYIAGLY